MVDFRPHILQVVTYVSGGRDADGVLLPDAETIEEIPCRIESNGSAGKVHYEDGVAYNYSFTVYLDQDCRTFTVGDKVRLIGYGGEAKSNDKQFEVIGFSRDLLHARLWV